ncbi:type I polyketide synthase [Actinophytocola sp. KF-1]
MTDEIEPIAVVGIAGRLPGARDLDEFWRNQCAGVESVTWFDPAELADPAATDPDYVPASAVVPDADRFDAEFFGYSPREADITDPQHRMFLEIAWEAFEDAGHAPGGFGGPVGVFAGCFMNKYLPLNLYADAAFMRSPHAPLARTFNDKDFLATRVSYLLDLRGPALSVQTACSTGLVAVHLACQSLWAYESDAALAGGVCLNIPLHTGYLSDGAGMFAPDGHCRPFDARARGTVPGYGGAAVVLRRLSDAVADRDTIRAVIRGSAINNDGSGKVSFTAPSVDAQAEVVATAQAVAGVDARAVGYVEAHGTGTSVGDPIEVAALTQAFRAAGERDRTGWCALGSVKANIGHLDAAAGVAGLIRATLAVQHGVIPPVAGFTSPNPELKLEDSPFHVPAAATPWASPRVAGVTSLGVGGTNAHAVLGEAPPPPAPGPAREWQLLTVSARDRRALDQACERLADRVTDAGTRLADVAYTLQAGRHAFDVRRFAVCRTPAEAAAALRDHRALPTATAPDHRSDVVFLFPGGGSQYPDMGLELYRGEAGFRRDVDECADLVRGRLGVDLRAFLFPSLFPPDGIDPDDVRLVLAGILTVELALARLWLSWGVRPSGMVGHSLGEYAAACVAGVFSTADALDLAVTRGEIFGRAPTGRMLAVGLSEDEVLPLLGDDLSLAALNAPRLSLVSGEGAAVEDLAATLTAAGVEHRRINIALASHSHLVEPYLAEFTAEMARYELREPTIPFTSGVTGTWITPADATDPAYWARHLRQPIRFASAVREAAAVPGRVFLEVGPGNTLTSLVGAQRLAPLPVAVASMRHPRDPGSDVAHLLGAVGRLWQAGCAPDWAAVHGDAVPRRVPLPTYPFQGRRHWIPADPEADAPAPVAAEPLTPRELVVRDTWAEVLGVAELGPGADFFAVGGNSFALSEMVKRLRTAAGVPLTPGDVYRASTIAQLAELIEARATGGVYVAPAVDLAAEPELAADITAAGLPPARPGPLRTVLLTGATGFVGPFLAAELAARTGARIRCLVRAESAADGRERLAARFAEYGLAVDPDRYDAVPGDLARPLLGVAPGEFDALADEVDAIYHCGAWVNFARPYHTLKPANVGGTQEVLRLATRHRVTPVHHVSTLAVLAGAFTGGAAEVFEDAPLPPPTGHDTGYSESKWVAEGVVALARERGIPVSVYRPGVVLPDSRTGVANSEDYVLKMITGCVRLGLAPLRDYPLSVAPVDAVAAAVVALSLGPPGTFHLVDPEPLPWNALFDRVRAAGYDVRSVPYDEWHAALAANAQGNPLEPLVDDLAGPADRTMSRVDTRNAGPYRGVPVDDGYVATTMRYLARRGWLP